MASYKAFLANPRAQNDGGTYFSAFSSKEAVLSPPLDSTNLVITGMNLAAMLGDKPSLWKASATSTVRPMPPGSELSRLDSSECGSDSAGAAYIKPLMPGTADDTFVK